MSFGSCQAIFMKILGLKRRMDITQEKLTTFNDDPDLLKKIITGEESWVYGYDIATKAQSSQWKRPEEPRPKKARQVRSNVKVLLTVFFDCNAWCSMNAYQEVVRSIRYTTFEVMRRLRETIRQKGTELFKNQSATLHHITHQLTHLSLCVSLWPKTKP